mgnify:CR=1 FL=1
MHEFNDEVEQLADEILAYALERLKSDPPLDGPQSPEELLAQAEQKFRAVNPDLKVGLERAESFVSPDDRVVIASIPTLGRADGTRLSRFNPDDFSVIVVDEAHHAVADTYRRILRYFGLFEIGRAHV